MVRDEWRKTNVRRGGTYGLATIPIQLKASGVKKSIDDALWNKGIRITPAKRHEFKGCHGFRKYCKTYAQRTMSSEYVAYNRPLEDWLVEAYLKAVTDLTIYKPVVEQTQELTAQMASKDKEIQVLKDNVKSMQEDMQDIFEVLRVVKRNGGRVVTDKTENTKSLPSF